MRPHSLPLVVLGAPLLWFGWFGFNAVSELAVDGSAASMALNTQLATAAAVLGWLVYERVRHGAFTTLGAASGAVAGLVAITPSGAHVHATGALAIGAVAGAVCSWAVSLKCRLGFDYSLDVVGVHLVGGVIGTLMVGFLAVDGLGGAGQFAKQAVGALSVMAFSFVVSWLIAKAVQSTIGFRADQDHEVGGVDRVFHAETAYDFGTVGGPAAPDRTTRGDGPAGVTEGGDHGLDEGDETGERGPASPSPPEAGEEPREEMARA